MPRVAQFVGEGRLQACRFNLFRIRFITLVASGLLNSPQIVIKLLPTK